MYWRLVPTCSALVAAVLVACVAGSGEQLTNYQNSDWGFTVSYPSRLGGHVVFVDESKRESFSGPEFMILLSDVKGVSPQQYDADESFRVLALREAVTDRSLQEWAISNWNSWGVELKAQMFGRCDGLISGEVDIGDPGRREAGIWVSQDQIYYAFITYYKPSVQESVQSILSSISITGCR